MSVVHPGLLKISLQYVSELLAVLLHNVPELLGLSLHYVSELLDALLHNVSELLGLSLQYVSELLDALLHNVSELLKISLVYVSELLKISLQYVLSALGKEPVLAPRKQRPERNLLTRMRNTTTGPLARLRDCTELRVRVKSLTTRPGSEQDKNSLTTRAGSEQDKNKSLTIRQGSEQDKNSFTTRPGSARKEQSLTTRPGSEQDKNRVLPSVLSQSKDQSKVRTMLPPVQDQSQDKNSLTTRPGSEQGKNRVLPPVQGQSKSGAPGGRTSNPLTPTRGLRRQSRLDWLLETGLESRSGVVKVVFPFSLQDDEIKMYRPRSCIPEVVSQVYIRNMKGIRGYCIAFVAAFDKHWNLALEDVTEVWTRPVKRKAVALARCETSWVSDRPPLQPLYLLSEWSEPLPQHIRLSHHLSELNLCKEVYRSSRVTTHWVRVERGAQVPRGSAFCRYIQGEHHLYSHRNMASEPRWVVRQFVGCVTVGPSPELQVQPSRVQVVKKDRRTETCERHVSQLMVRGEQVALIAILD
uniref:LSM domain-containing protein n=1 Tax=Timema shepardi TaxID=629360 RepID=A0A7R9G2T2_TIMSH|nr:unnamed protein product [Timema shepardi]